MLKWVEIFQLSVWQTSKIPRAEGKRVFARTDDQHVIKDCCRWCQSLFSRFVDTGSTDCLFLCDWFCIMGMPSQSSNTAGAWETPQKWLLNAAFFVELLSLFRGWLQPFGVVQPPVLYTGALFNSSLISLHRRLMWACCTSCWLILSPYSLEVNECINHVLWLNVAHVDEFCTHGRATRNIPGVWPWFQARQNDVEELRRQPGDPGNIAWRGTTSHDFSTGSWEGAGWSQGIHVSL